MGRGIATFIQGLTLSDHLARDTTVRSGCENSPSFIKNSPLVRIFMIPIIGSLKSLFDLKENGSNLNDSVNHPTLLFLSTCVGLIIKGYCFSQKNLPK